MMDLYPSNILVPLGTLPFSSFSASVYDAVNETKNDPYIVKFSSREVKQAASVMFNVRTSIVIILLLTCWKAF